MTFLASNHLFLLIIIPILGIFLMWRDQTGRKRLKKLGDKAKSLTNWHKRNIRIKQGLWLMGVAMLIIALARPSWGLTNDVLPTDNMALIIVLDVSQSMDAQDIVPSRLDRAKLILTDIINNMSNTQIGMVVFAGEAYVQLPLTADKQSARTFLNAISTQSITQQGTALESALNVALNLRDGRITSQTVMLVMSDGENHIGNPLIPAEQAKLEGVIIHSIGIGTPEGAEIPIFDETGTSIGSKIDAFGNIVITRLDENPLRQIADMTGGIYRRGTTTGSEIADILGQIDSLRDEQVQISIQNRMAERFHIFILLALALFGIEGLIPSKRRGL
jgi:Ca-activated chloride channel family protein